MLGNQGAPLPLILRLALAQSYRHQALFQGMSGAGGAGARGSAVVGRVLRQENSAEAEARSLLVAAALRADPGDPAAHYRLGVVQSQLGEEVTLRCPVGTVGPVL